MSPLQVISSSTSDTSSDNNIVSHVLIATPVTQGAKQQQQGMQDIEAGHGLQRSGSGGGLALPFTPMSVAFKDVSYFVPHPVSHSFSHIVQQSAAGN